MPKKLTERDLINKIRKEFSFKDARILTGIGDDAAVIRFGEKPLVVTKDLLVEDIHFLAKNHDPFQLGRKSLSVNLSDIAAMGCQPEYALLGLGLPDRVPEKWIQEYSTNLEAINIPKDPINEIRGQLEGITLTSVELQHRAKEYRVGNQ